MTDLAVTKVPLDFGAGLADAQEELAGAAPQVVNIVAERIEGPLGPKTWIRLAPGTSTWSWFPAVAAASAMALTGGGRTFIISAGTAPVSHLATSGWTSGDIVALRFEAATTVSHAAASAPTGYAALHLLGGVAATFAAGAVLYLKYDGTHWNQVRAAEATDLEVIGLTEFDGRIIFVTRDRRIWALSAGLVTALSTSTATTKLDGTDPPVFATTRTRIFIAGGGGLQYWQPTLATAARVPGAPLSSHIVANSQRLIANRFDTSGQMEWTEPSNDGLTHITTAGWDDTNFAEAEARPDVTLALHENSDELFLFGTRTVQIFTPDATAGYVAAYTLNRGLGARFSVINVLERRLFAWMTEDREIVLSSVRDDPTVISHPWITKTLKNMSTVDDCRGSYLKIGNLRLLVWRFPTAGETLAFDLDARRWFRLRGYDSTIGDYTPWPVACLHYWPEQNLCIAGLTTGEISRLDMDAATVGGQELRGEVILGYETRGTLGPKQTLILRAQARRGLGAFGARNPPVVEVTYRDRPGAWSHPVRLPLGPAENGQADITRRLTTRPYTRRQWRLQVAAAAGVSIGEFEETMELLEE